MQRAFVRRRELRGMQMNQIYMDHSATTYVDERVKQEMDKYYSDIFGNPGSFNSYGLSAKEILDASREKVAQLINAKDKEIIFTGSGTESINLAIQGIWRANKEKGNHIITSEIEHHAVLDTCEYLTKEEGANVTYLKPDKYGRISAKQVEDAITDKTILVTLMYANNEIGTLNPLKEIAQVTKAKKVYFHTDACQAAIMSLDTQELGVDLMTLNSSKIYGPKGVGMLYIRRGVKIKPLVFGGGQEFGLRSGTENIPGIVGFTKALEIIQETSAEESARLVKLRDKLIDGLLKIPKTMLNGHPTERLPNNVNVSFLDIEGEALLCYLDAFGVAASSGSACTSATLDPSHVIVGLGVPYEIAHGSLRLTLGRRTTETDVDHVIEVLPDIVERLRLLSPFELSMDEMNTNNSDDKKELVKEA